MIDEKYLRHIELHAAERTETGILVATIRELQTEVARLKRGVEGEWERYEAASEPQEIRALRKELSDAHASLVLLRTGMNECDFELKSDRDGELAALRAEVARLKRAREA